MQLDACHPRAARRDAGSPAALGRLAVRALYLELVTEPKPGLVTLRDSGSHDDMDAACLLRSLFSLRGYFVAVAHAGAAGADFALLERLGRAAEQRMLAATAGINAHRGAIFGLGLLAAARAACGEPGGAEPAPEAVQQHLRAAWGPALRSRLQAARARPASSHGQRAAQRHGLRGAGDEAADGMPTLFGTVLPSLRRARAAGASDRAARVQALFASIAVLDDTNLAHRGGLDGLRQARAAARGFLDAGGVHREGWLAAARGIHRDFVARRLSPGGSADLLACACWLDAVTRDGRPAAGPDPA